MHILLDALGLLLCIKGGHTDMGNQGASLWKCIWAYNRILPFWYRGRSEEAGIYLGTVEELTHVVKRVALWYFKGCKFNLLFMSA